MVMLSPFSYPGEVFRISSDGDDRIGAKSKSQKNPWTKN